MRVHLRALGCRLNEAELEQWAQGFQTEGYPLASRLEDADLLVLNTCAVTQDAVRKSRHLIHRLHGENPQAKMVVTGCYAALDPQEAARQMGVDLIVDNQDKDRLVELTRQALDLPTMPSIATEPGETALFSRGRHRAFIKIQDGCRYRCTFCIVTVARGEERSRSVADIVREINALAAQGVNEAVLTGVHVGGYGSDLGSDLYTLIKTILAETDIPRLRLASVEPWDLPDNFFTLFDDPRLMPHMHLPLQSGADNVLRRMARRCKTGEFERLVNAARARVPGFNVTTDVIVGFPGETDLEWQETLAFVERVGFGHLHIFSYSPRRGTKAAGLPNQISTEIKKRRSRELHALGDAMKQATLEAALGHEVEVLFERPSDVDADGLVTYAGYTPNYLRVITRVTPEVDLQNGIRQVRLERVADDGKCLLASLSS